MPNVNVDKELYEKICKMIKEKRFKYPNIRNFVNIAVEKKLKEELENGKNRNIH